MATNTFTTAIDHSSDAGFQAWATELFNEMTGIGLVQTADSGQLATPVVAARPTTNAVAGYWIFRFDDTNQGTAPVFIKVEPGTGTGAAIPVVFITVGTSTNGAGTITGVVSDRVAINNNSTGIISTATARTSRISCSDGFFGLSWKIGATTTAATAGGNLGFFAIARSVNSSGTASSDAVEIYWRGVGSAAGTTPQSQSIRHVGSTITPITPNAGNVAGHGSYCLIANGVSATTVGGIPQIFKHYISTPRVRPHPYLLSYVDAEIAAGDIFVSTPVGAATRTYIALGGTAVANVGTGWQTNGTISCAMLWE